MFHLKSVVDIEKTKLTFLATLPNANLISFAPAQYP